MGRKKKENKVEPKLETVYTPEEIQDWDEVVPAVEEEIASLKDKNLRLMAEMDNIRKNAFKDKQAYIKYKNESIGKDLLTVIDDFERCLQSFEKITEPSEETSLLMEGVKLIYNKLINTLSRNSITKMDIKEGDVFNADQHEAVSMIPAGEEMHNKIIAVTEHGYILADKVIRYPKVVVGQ